MEALVIQMLPLSESRNILTFFRERLKTHLCRKVIQGRSSTHPNLANGEPNALFEASPNRIARRFARARTTAVQPLLESLAALGQADKTEGGKFAA